MALKDEVAPFIHKHCDAYGINPAWVRAIITQESSWNPCAIRYESSYQWLFEVEKCANLAQVTLATELVTQKMSWGLGQIMGALAREQGLAGQIPLLLTPEINIKHMCKRLKTLKLLSENKDDIFAMYNGGQAALRKIDKKYRNQSYVDGVNSYLAKEEGIL